MNDLTLPVAAAFLCSVVIGGGLIVSLIRWLISLDDDELRKCRFKRRKP